MDVKVLLLTLISLLDTVGCLPPIVIGRFPYFAGAYDSVYC